MRKEVIKATDFTSNSRPKTRFAQFFDIMRHQKLSLVKVSLLQAVFSMPLLVSIVLFWNSLLSSDSSLYFSTFLFFGLSMLISFPCLFIGLTGTFTCMKRLAFADGIFASSNFFIGMKEEWKRGLVIGLLQGVINCLIIIASVYLLYYINTEVSWVVGLGIALLAILFIVTSIMSYYSISQVVTYSNPLGYVVRNSFLFTLMRFPKNLLWTIIHPAIVVILIAVSPITAYVAVGLLVLFSSFGYLLWMLNALKTFDQFINKEQYPDYYKKGLNKEIKED